MHVELCEDRTDILVRNRVDFMQVQDRVDDEPVVAGLNVAERHDVTRPIRRQDIKPRLALATDKRHIPDGRPERSAIGRIIHQTASYVFSKMSGLQG